MDDKGTSLDFGSRARRLRVDTLVRLRWLAIAGQLAAVLAVRYGLDFAFPLNLCLGAIAVSAALNIALRLGFPHTHRLADGPATVLLAFDICQLEVLLSLTGGIENPFAILALAPVMISAVSLPRAHTAFLLFIMAAASLAVTFAFLPLPWIAGTAFALPLLYRAGMWVSLCLGGAFVCIYAGRVADEARRLSDALAATELVLAREQHLTQLDGLAAAAAHELGTPLATITLVVKEILRDPQRGATREDIETLAQQTARCREILGTLTSLGSDSGGLFDEMTVSVLVEEAVAPHRNFGVTVAVDASGLGAEPRCPRSPGVLYGLGNLIENAVDFAGSIVRIKAVWTETHLAIVVEDDGPGFSPDMLLKAGEPYMTSRGEDRKAKSEDGAGLGLGLFIAKSLLERSGASLTTQNAAFPGHGAIVTVEWSRSVFEAKAGGGRSAPDFAARESANAA